MEKAKNDIITYQWEGVNKAGEKVNGVIDARSLAIAKADLRKQGIITKKVVKKRKPFFDKKNKKITQGDITVFSRQMATMIEAGIPLIQSFDIVAKGQSNQKMRDLIETIKRDVETGLTLAESLQKHPAYFNELFCNLVDAGEKSGSLEIMLDKVATYKEKIETIKKKIKKALTYPMAVLVVAFLVTTALMIFVVPQFESLFEGFGADLPAMTRMVVDMSEFFQSYWYIMFGAIGGAIYAFIYFKNHSPQFAHSIDRAMLKFPVVGPILEKAAIARFTRTLSITFAAGLPLVEALKSVSGATGNILYAKATDKIREEVSTGQQMQVAMDNTHLFPNMVIQMVAIGEESGALEQMLGKVADFYEEEVDNAVDALSSLLEPIIMSILGVLVGGLVVAMYLPIFKLGSAV
ncbi:type II secretion system F family protein [Legionella taurinensis]|uniref:Type II secretion system F family protein n=1 Tax=Legionella taurinensis TaxID=70611 RepID=A0A3A5LHJ4_9GAMM|nr:MULTISPECIES: type II secretion system F family protein [Legionella]MDX1836864.1 type II secretion system F family protein [Legionella taurinensis]PUT41279.1 type II secretion system protein F [Legionella taurinensis]PUT42404.1 type II secretion system protein F [Legionella taurinensis]PUT43930.1 type II secretion system protein F [Legionella taurinensis]PUT47185.1 type II secretion system protein F [Legionella taurinensis]